MSGKSKKTKKPLETSLGKATKNEKELDISHVQKPLDTNVFGLRQILRLFQTATDEVKNYITFECDVMYECRTCRSIFRSLANFILHKRNYCKERFNPLHHLNNNDTYQLVTSYPEKQEENTHKKSLNPIINKLIAKQEICELAQQVLKADFSSENHQSPGENTTIIKDANVVLEKIHYSDTAMFQTVSNLQDSEKEMMKNEVMELHGMLDNEGVVLDNDGKISHFQTDRLNKNPSIPKTNLYCSECDLKFSTKKTLSYHIKYKHNPSQTIYVCPDCKDSFANAWCVYRHLLKVHRKTTTQIRRMREQIHNSCVRRELQPKKKNREVERLLDKDEENQWLNNIEDDSDLQMCGGCGKRFERKAALHSHSATCAKRIAVCNQIKENNARKKEEQADKEKAQKLQNPSVPQMPVLKGALKRKPQIPKACERKKKVSNGTTGDNDTVEENIKDKIKQNAISDSEEEKLSPTKQCYSSSMEIDTEKMFNIIGISNGIDKGAKEKDSHIDPDLLLEIENNQVSFEVFCQKVSEKTGILTSDPIESNDTHDQDTHKSLSTTEEIQDDDVILISDSSEKSQDSASPDIQQNDIVTNLDEIIGVSPLIQKELSDSSISLSDQSSKELDASASSSEGFAGFPSSEHRCSFGSSLNTFKTDRDSSLVPKKRKRGFSIDIPLKAQKLTEKIDGDLQDTTFISKASFYMDQKELKCIPCKTTYSSFTELLWHMSAHFSWFRFQCSKCSFVSFNKHDCVSHARSCHKVDPFLLSGVVLPIPNWKTVLMSHDFCVLEDKSEDLSGKHTDEIIIFDENISNNCNDSKNIGTPNEVVSVLFTEYAFTSDVETEMLNREVDDNESIATSSKDKDSPVLNTVIDMEDNKETYKLNVPSDTPPHVSEIIKNTINEKEVFDNIQLAEDMTEAADLTDEYEEDDHFLPKEVVDKIERATIDEINEEMENNNLEENPDELEDLIEVNKNEELNNQLPVVKIRPVRNRIKTYQNDFFYDLNSIIKANNKELLSTQKQKKYNNSIQKSTNSAAMAHCSFTQKSKSKGCKK